MLSVYCNAETSEIIDIVEDRRLRNLYQDFLFLIKERSFNKFKETLENNYDKFKGILKVSLRTFKKYIDYIENSLNFEYSNGRIEGINRKIKVLKHIIWLWKLFEF